MNQNKCEFCNQDLDNSSHFTNCHSKVNFFTKISVCHHCINTVSNVEDFFYYPTPYSVFVNKIKDSINSNLISPDYVISNSSRERIESRFSIDMENQKRVFVKFLKDEKELIKDFLNKVEKNLKEYKFLINEEPYEHFNKKYKTFEFILDGKFVYIDGTQQIIR